MITLNYSANINAPREKVWQVLWNDATYRKWVAPFMEGSYAESTWEEGARILFLAPGKGGMFGIIEKKVPDTEMSFRHLGEIKNGKEERKNWENATERYFLSDKDGGTQLDVMLTMDDKNKDFENYFNQTFPRSLAVVKELAEN
jgi:uncharacterized protein YndB with AHSA1/START domain